MDITNWKESKMRLGHRKQRRNKLDTESTKQKRTEKTKGTQYPKLDELKGNTRRDKKVTTQEKNAKTKKAYIRII